MINASSALCFPRDFIATVILSTTTAAANPIAYIAATTSPDMSKYAAIAVNTASRALHGQNGVTNAARRRASSPAIPRVVSTAVAEQPRPSITENAARPLKPIFLKKSSVTNATRLIYPLSCKIAVSKYSMTTCGKNASTAPTPAITPSQISEITHGGKSAAATGWARRAVSPASRSDSGLPASMVITNTAAITIKNMGNAALPSNILSALRVRTFAPRGSITSFNIASI